MGRVNITTSLPSDLRDKLAAYSKENGVKMNTVIEEGIGLRMNGAGLPADLEKDLRAFAAANGVTHAAVMELALSRFLRERKGS